MVSCIYMVSAFVCIVPGGKSVGISFPSGLCDGGGANIHNGNGCNQEGYGRRLYCGFDDDGGGFYRIYLCSYDSYNGNQFCGNGSDGHFFNQNRSDPSQEGISI